MKLKEFFNPMQVLLDDRKPKKVEKQGPIDAIAEFAVDQMTGPNLPPTGNTTEFPSPPSDSIISE